MCDPDGKMWISRFSPGVCPTEPSNLVFSFGCLVSNGRRALLGGIRLGGSATVVPKELEARELWPAVAARELHPPSLRSSSARHGRVGARGGEAPARHGHARSSRRDHAAMRASYSLLLQSPPSLHSSRRAHCQWRLSPTPLRCAHRLQKMGRGGKIRVPRC